MASCSSWGGAGTGKSTTLDALAWELVDRAKNDSQAQIPVVLNLSSWNGLSQTLDDWLVGRAKVETRYRQGNLPCLASHK